ncbi:LysR family transcriptional regulator [Actibacterium ureilyticum]|uniref:LysR family transcriptional regulator n=1 Tax=Actibacterium ureilyticum TaxID=1590614 RepID=UPI000BAAD61C|nr:LysR family transcriptional regulator [Actibacterium ureilyticum]
MRPNHHQFIAFAYVVREGSFSGAAARLGVTQSTITQHVAKLERQVGTPLLLRTREGVSLTRTGQEFYDLADRLVALDAAIAERVEGFETMERGHLQIIANAPLPALRIIGRFSRAFPDVTIEFALHDWTTAHRILRDRRADVGVITDPPEVEGWEKVPLQATRYVAYVLPGSDSAQMADIHLRDLARDTIILPEHGSLTERVLARARRKHGVDFARTIRMASFPLMCEAVLQGAGTAIFLSDSGLVARDLVEVPIVELDRYHETAIVAPRDRARLRLVEAFIAAAGQPAPGAGETVSRPRSWS